MDINLQLKVCSRQLLKTLTSGKISPFATMFSTLLNNLFSFIKRDFSYFCIDVFKSHLPLIYCLLYTCWKEIKELLWGKRTNLLPLSSWRFPLNCYPGFVGEVIALQPMHGFQNNTFYSLINIGITTVEVKYG